MRNVKSTIENVRCMMKHMIDTFEYIPGSSAKCLLRMSTKSITTQGCDGTTATKSKIERHLNISFDK